MKDLLESHGYDYVRELPTGEYVGVMPMLFTVGLFVGLDDFGYRTRFCYPDFETAAIASKYWTGAGDPPGPWIKEKPINRDNPNRELYKTLDNKT